MDTQDSNTLYDIYFKGEILEGFVEADVRASLQALFKAPASKIDQMFCGKAVAIKKDVDKATALKYQNALKKAGAKPLISAKPQSGEQIQSTGQTQSKEQAQSREQIQNSVQAEPQPTTSAPKKQSLAERLAELDKELSQQEQKKPETTPRPTPAQPIGSSQTTTSTQTTTNTQTAGLNILPVGADMLTNDEREVVTPVNVDISALSMAEVGTRIGEENQEPEPPAPDTDYLSVAETGADMNPDKPIELPLPEFDLSNMSVADTGEQLVEPSPEPLPPALDLSNITLADVGVTLAETSNEPEAKAPDVSHIQLAD